jgi:hypothetical protein
MQPPLSAASTRVLRDAGAPPGEILKLAIKELVLAGTWRIAEGERTRRMRRPEAVTVLLPGDRPPPGRVPLGLAHSLISSGPVERWGPVEGREVRSLAKHIARTRRRIGTELVSRVAVDLDRRGLVEWEQHRRFGLFRRSVMVPTAAGQRVLEQYRDLEAGPELDRIVLGDRVGTVAGIAGLDALGGLDHVFDSAFDAGFSDGGGFGDGGGDGGGGDGGGGDGGGN